MAGLFNPEFIYNQVDTPTSVVPQTMNKEQQVNDIPEFIDRINNPKKYPVIWNKDGSYSTHKMAAEVDEKGNWFVFPTIVRLPSGELYEFKDNGQAMDYNLKVGNFLPMSSKESALSYAEGGYKTGTPLLKYKPKNK